MLAAIRPDQVVMADLAGEAVLTVESTAPGGGPLGGVRVRTQNGWFAARPSGTEAVYKIYAESFLDPEHLSRIQDQAGALISGIFAAPETQDR